MLHRGSGPRIPELRAAQLLAETTGAKHRERAWALGSDRSAVNLTSSSWLWDTSEPLQTRPTRSPHRDLGSSCMRMCSVHERCLYPPGTYVSSVPCKEP